MSPRRAEEHPGSRVRGRSVGTTAESRRCRAREFSTGGSVVAWRCLGSAVHVDQVMQTRGGGDARWEGGDA